MMLRRAAQRTASGRFRRESLALTWVLGLTLCGAAAWHQLGPTTAGQLVRGGEQAALTHAHDLAGQLPGIENMLAGGTPSPEDAVKLERMRRIGQDFRFKLFDSQGQPLVDSESLHCTSMPCMQDVAQATESAANVTTLLAGRRSRVELHDADAAAGSHGLFS